jgi:FAD/FMN-containing dehydrogenase/Fe-S oxidoreductase
MISAQQQAALAAVNCEIAFDSLTLQLYSTDASIYQVEPGAVGFPRTPRQASDLIKAAAQAGVPVIPRGAGSGLTGGAIGEGLVIDFSRYLRQITDLDLERQTVVVGPGVVLDQLNAVLKPHGFRFGPDVAASSRATLGGMIANDSSGSHTPVYGTTGQHVLELDVVLADGRIVAVGPQHDTLRKQKELVGDLVCLHGLEIAERLPKGLSKRRAGYALDRCLREPENLLHLICGSEGTLVAITCARLKIVPLPKETGLGLLFFPSVAEAMQASVELLDLKPAAIEHLDRPLLDQTRGQMEFGPGRDLLELDQLPCESVLAVEFFENVDERLAALDRRKLGLRKRILRTRGEMDLVWKLRKAGLALLVGRKGSAKPATGIEDAAVQPALLPAYVEGLRAILDPLKIEASFYGHAAAGLLHVRPILDLHTPQARKNFRQIASEVSALVRQFNGSLAGEHGVGISRTEFMPEQVGENLLGVMRKIKAAFDPNHLFNPGKIIPDGRYLFDEDLRSRGHALELPFEPVLAFQAKDGSFLANLDQCNGCGGCRKETPSMCPTFIPTGEELLSTRGRANAIRAAFSPGAPFGPDPLASPELEKALDSCLGCRACVVECPSNVDLALLKVELLHARASRDGLTLMQRLVSAVDLIGRIGCRMPRVANFLAGSLVVRTMLSKATGYAWQRPLPLFARQRFDRWFERHPRPEVAPRGRVVLWDDTFVRYHEPHIGIAAVKVLEAAGFEVVLPTGRRCCGRPAFSQGNLDEAMRLGRHNLNLLNQDVDQAPILFLEPSCYSMFARDYAEMKLDGAERVMKRCALFEKFLSDLLIEEPGALRFQSKASKVVIHAHCHLKSLMDPGFLRLLAQRLPNREVTLLDSACCGMAGAFGAMSSKYELSLKVAEPLVLQVRSQPFGTVVVASGTSCRHQISHLTPLRPRHMAEVLADALS